MKYVACSFNVSLLFFCLLCPFNHLQSQVSWNNLTADNMTTVCLSEEGLTLNFSVGATGTYVLEVNPAQGITYTPGTATISANAAIVAETFPAAGTVEFEINVTATGQVELVLDKIAGCAALDYIGGGGILRDTATVFSGGIAVTPAATSGVYSLSTPNVDIQNVTTLPTSALVGETVTRTLSITNSGFGYLSDFVVAEVLTPGELTYANFSLTSGGNTVNIDPLNIQYTATQDTCFISFGATLIQQIGDFDAFWETGETFTLSYEVSVQDCSQNQINSSPSVYWSCNGSICASDAETATITIPTTNPEIEITLAQGGPDSCYGYLNNFRDYVFEIKNTGTGSATNLRVNMSFESNFITGYDPNAVTYRIDAGAETPITADEVLNILEDDFLCQTNAPETLDRQAWWLFPSLAAGSSIFLTFNEVYTCNPGVCIEHDNNLIRIGGAVLRGLTFDDVCGGNSQNLGTQQILRNELFYADAISIPANLIENANPQDVILDFTDMDASGLIYDATTAYWEIQVTLPDQVDISGGIGDISWIGGDGQVFTPSFSDIQDGEMTVRYLVDERPNREGSTFRFPLVMDCTEAAGGSAIDITVSLVPSTNCPNVASFIMGCHTQPIQLVCQTCTDAGMEPLAQTFERFNTGTVDYDNNGCPDDDNACDGSLQVYTGPDQSAFIRTDKALAGDTISSKIIGVINTNATYPSWQFVYLEDEFELPALWSFVQASASIYDLSTTTAYTVQPLTATPTATGYTFDLSVASLGGTLPGGFVYEDGDTVTVSILYRLDEVGTTDVTPFKLTSNLLTSDIANPTAAVNKFSCNTLDGTINAVDVNLELCCDNTLFYEGCDSSPDEKETRIQIAGNDTGGQFFPYEYRVLSTPQVLFYTVPPGYTLDSTQIYLRRATANGTSIPQAPVRVEPTANAQNGDGSISYEFDLFDPSNSGIWVQNGGSMFLSDEGYKIFSSFFLSPGCNSPDSYTLALTDPKANGISMLQNNGQLDTVNMNSDLQYRAPQLSTTSPQATITGNLTEVSWDISLSNASTFSDATFSWIRLFSPTNLVGSNSLVLADDLGNPILPNADGIYEVGAFTTGSSQDFSITADVANCQSDSMIVFYGWDCTGYPADPANPDCDPASLTLYLNATEAQLTSSFSSLFNTPVDPTNPAGASWNRTDVDMCDAFPVELTLSATEAADLGDIVIDLSQNLVSGLNGLDYISTSAYIEYPVGTTPRQIDAAGETALLTPDAQGNWTLNLADLDATNFGGGNLLRGSYRPDSNTVIIRWEFQPNCNFVSGASLNVQTLSYTSCGALANGSGTVGSSLEIPIAGVTNPYSIQFDDLSLSDSFLGCSDAQALSISFQKVGATAVAVEDSIQVFLPAGLGFDAYGGCLSGLCVDDTKRTVRTVGAQTVVSWPLPNLLDGEESSFFIEVIDNGDLFCTESEPINVQTIHQTSVFCPAISANCNSTVTVTGSEEVTPLADKPQLTPFFQNVLSGTFPDNPPAQRHEFRFDVTVTNAGQNTTGDVEVWIFCANSEGTLGSDATPLQIIQIPGPIAAGSASTINVNFFDDACNPSVNGLIALIPDDLSGGGNQCFCPWPAGLDETAANPGILPYEGVSTAEISAVLPIAFLAFSVAQENQYAVLNWTTFEDASANAYTLERSLDGSSFSPIHHQNSRGNIGRATYSFTDQQLLSLRADRIYYRVAHVDINGAFSYSSVIELAVAPVEELSVSAYPNPATEQVVLDIFLPTSSYYRLEVVNKLGQSMYVSSLPNSSPSLRRTLAVAEWPAGLYLIKVGDAREQITYKLLVR